jgi:hypothetical protein
VTFDRDGKARIVISAEDPGTANWLDTVGNPKGVALMRWYFTDSYPTPAARLVSVADLRALLPADTAWVTPEERRRAVDERRAAVLKRYGH